MFKVFITCAKSLDKKLVPWSVWIILGSPKVAKNFINACITTGAVIFRKGTASGKRVAVHMIVSRNWLPVFVFGNGPTQSIRIFSNGSPITGIGHKGAGGIVWLGFPVIWQTWQEQQMTVIQISSVVPLGVRTVRFPLASWSASIASNKDLKFPAPNPCTHRTVIYNIKRNSGTKYF